MAMRTTGGGLSSEKPTQSVWVRMVCIRMYLASRKSKSSSTGAARTMKASPLTGGPPAVSHRDPKGGCPRRPQGRHPPEKRHCVQTQLQLDWPDFKPMDVRGSTRALLTVSGGGAGRLLQRGVYYARQSKPA